MLTSIYALPGWGFSSEIFSSLNTADISFIGLDYFSRIESTFESLVKSLSTCIPDNATLLAWSFGGLFAIQLASLFPEKVKKLLLISSQPRFLKSPSWKGIDPTTRNNFIDGLKKNPQKQMSQFLALVNYPNYQLHYKNDLTRYLINTPAEKLLSLLTMLFDIDLRKEYSTLSSKILHIINKEDAVITQNENQLKTLNPSVDVINLEKSGHAGFLTHPHFYQTIIKSAIDS